MISFFAIIVVYFGFSWGLPWNKIPSTISFSYIFDFVFALTVSFFYRLPWKFKWKINKQALKAFVEVFALAVGVIGAIYYLDIQTPFRLVNNLEIHLLLLAPLLEELVFRQTFQRVLIHNVGGKNVTSMLVASIFAFSHLVGLMVLPAEFVPFIGFQVFYTFVLGVICGQALLKFQSLLAPIILHFIFNLSFYVAMQLEII